MGRIAGVTADETRQRLLDTAAVVFGRLGYDGASISRITAESGLSSGAIYAHYASKAELFVATLRAHAEVEFERLLGGDGDMASFLLARAEALDRRRRHERALLIEAIVAAKRHPEVAELLTTSVRVREGQLVALLEAAQALGEIDGDLSAEAVARFSLMVALGSLVAGALDLPPIDHRDWAALVARVVDSVRTTTEETT